MEKEKKNTKLGRQPLPIVAYGGKHFFTVDLKGKRFIPLIAETLSFGTSFDSEEGKIMCRNAGVVTCKNCGMSAIISKAYEEKELRCMHCFSRELIPLYEEHNKDD